MKLSDQTFKGPAYLLIKEARAEFDIPYSEKTFSDACAILEGMGCLHPYSHPGMMRYYRIDGKDFFSSVRPSTSAFNTRLYQIGFSVDKSYPVLESYADLGEDWLSDAVETFHDELWTQIEGAEANDAKLDQSIPASDRTVTKDHNRAAAQEITSALQEIEDEVRRSNEAFEGNPESKGVALAEISALRAIWDAAQVRILIFQARAAQTLEWVAEKAASAAISELCKHALKLILGWS